MRKAITTSALFALLLAIAGTSPLFAEARSIDGQYDIDGLLQLAGKNLDLENEDAVILFQRFETRWVDGRLSQTTHRATLIRTSYGLNRFADLRIPWDGARQKLTVNALRTYRLSDEQWITAGPTAVVETLPFAVDRAPDYCHLRETMLLHDGVELPCVVETSWTVEDTESFRPGASGTQSLMGSEPALLSQFILTTPAGKMPAIEAAGGAPQPTLGTDPDTDAENMIFEMMELAAAPHPATNESIRQQPRVSWSTWEGWGALVSLLETRIVPGAVVDDALREALDEKLAKARTAIEKARLVAEFVGETTRLVGYGSSWWPEPRPAHRTWATGYGHRVDRAILAAALYSEAGLYDRPVFRSAAIGDVGVVVPGLEWSEGVSLLVTGDGVSGWYDPESSRFAAGENHAAGRTVWVPARDDEPAYQSIDDPDRLVLRCDLSFDGEKKAWTGSGVLESSGTISPYHRMIGLGSEAKDHLSGLIGTLLGGATVGSCNPECFEPGGVTMGFDLEVPAGERDSQGRLNLLLEPLPAGLHVDLYAEARESDVYLPAPLDLQVELHLEPGDLETVHLPEDTLLVNDAGLWQVETSREEDGVLLIRRLQLTGKHYPAAQWPELRALLLAAQHKAGQVLYFK